MRLARTLCLSIATGCLLGHSWHPASGQTLDQNGNSPGVDDDRDDAHVTWAQRIVLASGDSFVGTLSGWESDQTWTFDVGTPARASTNQPSKDVRQRTVAASNLVRYGTIPPPESTSGVLLVDGSELSGRIVELNTDGCRLVSRWFDVSIPLESVRSLLFHAPVEGQIRQQQLEAAKRASGADDVILLIDGGRREGTLRLSEASVSPQRSNAAVEIMRRGDEAVSIPLRRIRSIIPSPILREDLVQRFGAGQGSGGTENAPPPHLQVALIDGSVLSLEQWRRGSESRAPSVVLECGVELTSRRRSQPLEPSETVAMLAPVPLPATCLTTEPPLRYRHLPFFGQSHPLVRWGVEQTGALLSGSRYPHGLLMRTAARAVYPAKGAKRLTGAVAVAADPSWETVSEVQMQTNLGVRFRVQTSGPQGELDSLWDSGVVRPGQPPVPFDLEISGAALIILAVDSADSGDFGDRAVWLDLVAAGAEGP